MAEAAAYEFRPPARVTAPTEGRHSIVYAPLAPIQDTTRLFMVDNKASDVSSLNVQQDHSDFFTNVVHNADVSTADASTQDIKLDERSRWVGELRTVIKTCCPNVTEFNNSNGLKIRVPVARKASWRGAMEAGAYEYAWRELTIPEGNYSLPEIVDLLNDAVVRHFLKEPRLAGLDYNEIGVKFDTRLFTLGEDPATGLVTPGTYTYKAYHPDVILLPGCAVDFTTSRLSNVLGIRKRKPYEKGFVIAYDDLEGGNLPALMNVTKYLENGATEALSVDGEGKSYWLTTVSTEGGDLTRLSYRSWATAYHAGGKVREWTLLTTPDVTGGLGQIYWSLPDAFQAPVTFAANARRPSEAPVVASQLFPVSQRSVYNGSNVYCQMVEKSTNGTVIFDRFSRNEVYRQPPYGTVVWISENVPTVSEHGQLPVKHSISGVQRVTVTDDRRRTCPYVYKCLAFVDPRVVSSATLQ